MPRLSSLLAHTDLGLRLVQAGPIDPEVSWASITELLDLGDYLEGGEIIMTTGLALGRTDRRWRDFVSGLSRAQVAAIGFGVEVNHPEIPPPLIRAASDYRLALFEVPLPTPFIAVSKAVAELIRADELRAAQATLRTGERLLGRLGGEHDPSDVLASITQATGRQLQLRDPHGVVASTAGFHVASAAGDVEEIALDTEGDTVLIIANGAPLTPEGRSVIAAGAMVLSVQRRGAMSSPEAEAERWGRVTTGLLREELPWQAALVLDPALATPPRLRAMLVQGAAEQVSAWLHRPKSGLARLACIDAETPAPGLTRAWQICPDTEAALTAAIAAATAHGLDAVVGRPTKPAHLTQSARSATRLGARLSRTDPLYQAPRQSVVRWADRDAPLFEALEALGDATRLSDAVLGPLARSAPELDPTEQDTLRSTLRSIAQTNGLRGPAAAQLGIHRNTLRDRITRIERLTRRSLADPDDRAELWLALRLDDAASD